MVVPMHYDTFDVIKQNPEIFVNKINMWNISLWKILKAWEFVEYR
jgi:L-ascorbate metabolism protein UlaG (beta-lactamase superfamily)